jgi:type IV fimbrial biogenesis protein FimT
MSGVFGRHGGFSILELMITLALAGVLVGLAVPNMRAFNQNNRLTAASNDLLHAFQVARNEAITRQRNVVVCASNNPTADNPDCSYGPFVGWFVFQDTNNDWQRNEGDIVIDQHNLLSDTVTVRTDNDGIQSFNFSGFANVGGVRRPTRNIVICDTRGVGARGENSMGRALLLTPTGRARVTKAVNEVSDALRATGADGCP